MNTIAFCWCDWRRYNLPVTFWGDGPPHRTLAGSLAGLNYPLLETQDEWVLHSFSFANYLEELGPEAQQEIYKKILDRSGPPRCIP